MMTTKYLFDWTDEKIKQMIDLHTKGHKAREIAEAIGAPSRNAVLGKLYRVKNDNPKIKKPLSKPRKVAEIKQIDSGITKSLLALKKCECRWPIDTAFCSNPTDGGSYCERHKKIAYRKVEKMPDRGPDNYRDRRSYY